jgi:hypothetical protein
MFYQLIGINYYNEKFNLIFGNLEGLAAYVADNNITPQKINVLTEEEFNKLAEDAE